MTNPRLNATTTRLLSLAIAFLCICQPCCTNAWSFEKTIVDWVKTSTLFADLHQEHVASDEVRHMMKATPLVDAPDDAKMDFAMGPFGKMVADMMASEQALLGDWKLKKIVEAAGGFDEDAGHQYLLDVLNEAPITLVSFVDCPWCLLAKKLLKDEYQLGNSGYDDKKLQIIELEELGRNGKTLRAAISLATGRTSMPACFIGGKSIGGYTDGFEEISSTSRSSSDNKRDYSGFTYTPMPDRDLRYVGSPGLAKLHETGKLAVLMKDLL